MDGARLVETAEDPLLGRTIERYRIERVLGSGGMATVYQVHHLFLEKPFAMKVLHGEIASDPSLAKRFQREAKALSRIRHPNVVSVVDFGVSEKGLLFMVMERLRGQTLGELVQDGVRLAPERARRLAHQIAMALQAAHREGFIHRDLKPSNIMVVEAEDGESIRLMDFGLVRVLEGQDGFFGPQLTQVGQFFGTPAYMAPEQVMGNDTSAATDLYALGVILFQLLEGQTPFTGDLKTLTYRQVHEPPPALSEAYGGLADVVRRLLNKQPEDRPSTALQLAERLEALAPLSTAIPPPAVPPRLPPPRPISNTTPARRGRDLPATGPRISGLPDASTGSDGPQVVIDPALDGSGPRARPPARTPRTGLWVLILLLLGGALGVVFAQRQEAKHAAQPAPYAPQTDKRGPKPNKTRKNVQNAVKTAEKAKNAAPSAQNAAPAKPAKAADKPKTVAKPAKPQPKTARSKRRRTNKRHRRAVSKRQARKAKAAAAAKTKAAAAADKAQAEKKAKDKEPPKAKAEEKAGDKAKTADKAKAKDKAKAEAKTKDTGKSEAKTADKPKAEGEATAEEKAKAEDKAKAEETTSVSPAELKKLHRRLKRTLAKRGLSYEDLLKAKEQEAKNWLRWVDNSGDPPAAMVKLTYNSLLDTAKTLPTPNP